MEKTIRSFYLIKINYYSSKAFFKILKSNKIKIYFYNKVSEYDFIIKIQPRDLKKIKNLFSSTEIISSSGIIKSFELINKNKIFCLMLVISICFYFFINTRIFKIEIRGVNSSINAKITQSLNKFNIKKYEKKPSINDLKQIENILKMELLNDVDLISLNSKGNYIFVSYSKKGENAIVKEKNGKLYAKKDGIIKFFDIESGKILKEINDYVKKGDLLVDDTLYYKDKPIKIGTYGKVYAYTFNEITISLISTGLEKSEIYQILLNKARNQIISTFDEKSYIDKEIITSYINQNGVCTMKIVYTIVENIAIF